MKPRIYRRPGRFTLTHELLASLSEAGALAIQSEVIISAIRDDFITMTTEYRGYSRHFRELRDGDTIPRYSATIRNPLPGVFVVDWAEIPEDETPRVPISPQKTTPLQAIKGLWKRIRKVV